MLTTIARYSMPYEAQIAKVRLDAEGIPAFIADEHTINMQWIYSNALGGVRLQVPESYAELAFQIIQEDRSVELIEEQGDDRKPCVHCGSKDTEFYQIGKRWAFAVFIGISFPLFPVKDGIRCKACGKIST